MNDEWREDWVKNELNNNVLKLIKFPSISTNYHPDLIDVIGSSITCYNMINYIY